MNIGQLITYLILNSTKSNTEILEIVKTQFEGCKTSPACIAWYKSKLRKEGLIEKGRTQKYKVEMTQEQLEALTK
jgi:hypothetical protein